MKKIIKSIVRIIKEAEYDKKTLAISSASTITGILLFLYNEYIGILHDVSWSIAIGIYYLFFAVLRGIVIGNSIRKKHKSKRQETTYVLTHVMLLLINLYLIEPITIMIRGERSYTLGLVPAIILAAYTAYRITLSIIHYIKTRKNYNLLIGEIRLINLVDSLVAILTSQNTMIIAMTGEISASMQIISIISSSGIWIVIMLLTIASFVKMKKREQ